MKLMWHYTMRNKKLLVFNFICVFGFILIELGLPTLLARMIDKGIAAGDSDYIWKMGAAMIAITIVGITMNILLGYFTSRITTTLWQIFVTIFLKKSKAIHIPNMKKSGFHH